MHMVDIYIGTTRALGPSVTCPRALACSVHRNGLIDNWPGPDIRHGIGRILLYSGYCACSCESRSEPKEGRWALGLFAVRNS